MMRRFVPLVIVTLWVGACEAWQPARTCDEVNASVLRNIMQQPESVQEVRRQIANGYSLAQEQVLMSAYADETQFQWSKDNVNGSFRIGGAKPVAGGLYYNSQPPTVATVMGCLGTPDFYRSYYQRGGPEVSSNSLELDLFFARQGIVAAAYVHGDGKEPPKLNTGLPMQAFGFAPVTSLEETMDRLNENNSPEVRHQIKPWPGKLEAIVIEIDPDLTR